MRSRQNSEQTLNSRGHYTMEICFKNSFELFDTEGLYVKEVKIATINHLSLEELCPKIIFFHLVGFLPGKFA